MATIDARIKVDRDWLALLAYRMTLEAIAESADDEPWKEDSEAAEMARHVLEHFPVKGR